MGQSEGSSLAVHKVSLLLQAQTRESTVGTESCTFPFAPFRYLSFPLRQRLFPQWKSPVLLAANVYEILSLLACLRRRIVVLDITVITGHPIIFILGGSR